MLPIETYFSEVLAVTSMWKGSYELIYCSENRDNIFLYQINQISLEVLEWLNIQQKKNELILAKLF